jgi:hypothetical protein
MVDRPGVVGFERVAVLAACGLSRFVGEPVSATSMRNSTAGFVKQLEQTELGNLLDMPNDELMRAGNGIGELGRGLWCGVPCMGAYSQPSPTSGSTDGGRDVRRRAPVHGLVSR